MWPKEEQMETFLALSGSDKWRVRGYVLRGEAPRDPHMAVAAAELAEAYQRQGPLYRAMTRWWPILLALTYALMALLWAIRGDTPQAAIFALLAVLTFLTQYMLNPATRPKRVARSLAASNQIIAANGGRPARVKAPAPPPEPLDDGEPHGGLDLEAGYGWSMGRR
jgi:hypothetical protein